MSVTMSKPPKKTTITRPKDAVRGVRWRSREERQEAKRKIEAIRRAAALEREERLGNAIRLDAKALRSPKVIFGILVILTLLLLVFTSSRQYPHKATVEMEPLIQRRVKKSLNNLAIATVRFRNDTGDWPSLSYGLFELCHNYGHRGYKGPYIDWNYKDPWGTPFVYIRPESKYEPPVIYSCGPDKAPETADDILLPPAAFTQESDAWQTPPETATDAATPDAENAPAASSATGEEEVIHAIRVLPNTPE